MKQLFPVLISLTVFCPVLHAGVCPDYLAHHSVQARAIVPGVYSLRLALEAARRDMGSVVGISDFVVRKPLPFRTGVEMSCAIDTRDRVACSSGDDVFSRGKILKHPLVELPLPTPLGEPEFSVEAGALYLFLQNRGLDYGDYFQRLSGRVAIYNDFALGRVQKHRQFSDSSDPIHPTVLDSALHAVAAFAVRESGSVNGTEIAVPVRFETVFWNPAVSTQASYQVIIRRHPPDESRKQLDYDLVLMNELDQVVFGISRGTLQALSPAELFR